MTLQYDKYFYDVTLECPYGLPGKATYRQTQFSFMHESLMKYFMENGYRRNGNYIYTMACQECKACIPIRIDPLSFNMNRNQRRVWRANQDLRVTSHPLQITNEKLAICDKFLQDRFPGKGNSALEYYAGFFVNTLDWTYEFEMWDGEYLIGVSIVDIIEDTMNCVYFYFDPDAKKRSPGTFNILYMVDFALKNNIKHVYLGYFIQDVPAMSYKSKFKPHQLFIEDEWQEMLK